VKLPVRSPRHDAPGDEPRGEPVVMLSVVVERVGTDRCKVVVVARERERCSCGPACQAARKPGSSCSSHRYTLTLTSHDEQLCKRSDLHALRRREHHTGSPPPPPPGGIVNGGFETGNFNRLDILRPRRR